MSLWTWVLVGLCAAGAALALGAALRAVLLAMHIPPRLEALAHSRLALSIESLKLQGDRFGRMTGEAEPVLSRARAAIASIRASIRVLRMADARDALESAGTEIRALYRDLR